MRNVIFSMMISLDGYFEGPGEGWEKIDWHRADDQWEQYSVELLSQIDTLLFGRKTYVGFAEFWPTQQGDVARLLNNIDKVVVSTTLTEATWNATRLVRDHVSEEIARLKAQPGKDIAIFGSAELAATLMQHDLIDEYRIAVNPVVLGGGTALFQKRAERLNLRLLDTRIFRSGIVELRYARSRSASITHSQNRPIHRSDGSVRIVPWACACKQCPSTFHASSSI
jgi:dihydrofolate reductase